jgi:nucleotide-binding universal stress UspA family protein
VPGLAPRGESMSTVTERAKIVVGVDGSRAAAKALAWALDEARLRKCRLQVVHSFPALVSYAGTTAHEYYPQVKKEAEQAFDQLLEDLPKSPDVEIERTLVSGSPAGQLVDASSGASLLVVGSRGMGGFRGLLAGSVSTQVVHHAHCPVVVIKDEEAEQEEQATTRLT